MVGLRKSFFFPHEIIADIADCDDPPIDYMEAAKIDETIEAVLQQQRLREEEADVRRPRPHAGRRRRDDEAGTAGEDLQDTEAVDERDADADESMGSLGGL